MARHLIPSSSDYIIDSRDIIARIDDLTDDRDRLYDALDTEDSELQDIAGLALCKWFDDCDCDELTALLALQDECEGYGDWRHGATLIADSYFETYAHELAEDIGAMKDINEWPYNHIDWDAAADALKSDYSSVDFDGVTFWIRA